LQVTERLGGQGFWVLFAREKYLPEGKVEDKMNFVFKIKPKKINLYIELEV